MLEIGNVVTNRDGSRFEVTKIESISYHHNPPSQLVTLVQVFGWGDCKSRPFTKKAQEVERGEFKAPKWIWR